MTIKFYHDLIQGSQEWRDLRTGIITASQVKLILSKKLAKVNNEKSRAHVYEIAAQREMQNVEETFDTWAMQRGKIEEIYAKDLYSKHYDKIRDCGFITNDKLGFMMGCSPDALMIGKKEGLEVKSRNQKLQMEVICKDEVPEEDMLQVQSNLFVSGYDVWTYLSYSNGMPMYVKRVLPDPDYFKAIEETALDFEAKTKKALADYTANCEKLRLVPTERKDHETGLVIKPSENAEEKENLYMAG